MFDGIGKMFNKGIESSAGGDSAPKKEKHQGPVDYTENYALLECETSDGRHFTVKSYVDPVTLYDVDKVTPSEYERYFRTGEYKEVSKTIHPFNKEENEQE